ncbi:MAG: mltG [Hydrocarboniphaga sp.]|uniref:endolytic transglycosylase MltG n=1 Tax=Hydrocarboniphaga sp. TaxID=2033016 RepID=UPI002605C31E|nr:endolytic transglycosylase MltG [Hydrocarboniphaga sp.]MDB5968058.1 mltG [Hydrocarboniphaga sp.]
MRRFLIRLFRMLGLLILLAIAIAAWLVYDGNQQLSMPLKVAEPSTITIAPGARIRDVILQLHAQQRLASLRQGAYLEAYARGSGKAAGIKAGEYRLEPGISAYQALELWRSGKVVVYELRIVEGTRFDVALQQVMAHPQIRHTLTTTDKEKIMAALGLAGKYPEGRFFPDTYLFPRDTVDVVVLRRAFDAMTKVIDAEWQTRAADLPYSNPDEALSMASIVEKETGAPVERPQIAGVFVRRLRMGMRLQTDPTVIYGLGDQFDGNLRKRDLLAANPYNTYLNTGLPPTPICLPGRAAINAALHPADGDALYFVSRGDGTHQFSATLEEHEAAVRRYQLGGRAPPPTVDPTTSPNPQVDPASPTP